MCSKLSKLSRIKNLLMLVWVSTVLAACGDGGRDPILGNEGNVALSPTVIAVTPEDNSTDVMINGASITARFSVPVDPLTISDFTLTCSGSCTSPSGKVSMNDAGTVTTFTPTNPAILDALTVYTATIHNAKRKDNGIALENSFIWSFTTSLAPETIRPRVTLTDPETKSPDPIADVPVNTSVVAVFNEDMAPAMFTDKTFTFMCDAPCVDPLGEVSYDVDSKTARFTPAEDLEGETTYTATISRRVTDLSGNELAGNQGAVTEPSDYVWQFTTGLTPDTTRPRVILTDPATRSPGVTTDVPVNTSVLAVFNENMVPSMFTDTTFTLTCQAPCVAPQGSVSYDVSAKTALFTTAEDLESETTYTATISQRVTDLAGNELAGNQGAVDEASDYVWQFTTGLTPDTTRPRVTLTEPETTSPGPTTDVPINTSVVAMFNENMVASMFTDATFTLTCEVPCTAPLGTVSYDVDSKSALFTPAEDLESETTYTATISQTVTDLAGNELAGNQGSVDEASDYVWQFTTGLAPDTTRPRVTLTEPETTSLGPTTDVPTNTKIKAIFSEAMLAKTIAGSSFTLTCEEPCVAPFGTVSYDVASRSAIFEPEQNLAEGATYTATLSSTITDLAGNELAGNQGPVTSASDYVWSFTTTAPIEATNISVASTDPLDVGTMEVCPNASINATFDIPSGSRLDPDTVNNTTFLIVEDANPLNSVLAESIKVDVDTGTVVTFIPQEQLPENVTYRVTLVGGADGVKDLIVPGNEMLEDFVWTFTTVAPVESCLEPVALRSAAPFGSFGGTAGITNQGVLTIINGDIGTTGASTVVTGFVSEPGCEYTITTLNEGQVNGKIFTAPPPPTVACPQDGTAETAAIANQARLDAEEAYISMTPANLPGGQDPGNENLGSLTLTPGIYTAQSGAFSIQGGDLTLDAQGNSSAVWVFQMATTLTVGGPGADFPQSVTLINGAQAKNIFWQVGSAATINAAGGGTMKGTIIAQDGVSISTAGNVNIVTLDGRALSLGASVTVVNTVINVPAE